MGLDFVVNSGITGRGYRIVLIRHYLGRRFIAGASYGYLEILLCNILCYILESLGSRKRLLYEHLCKYGPT